jgi:hypothetical protein
MPHRPKAPDGWETHLSESALRYYFYNPTDGAAVWPGNLATFLKQKQKPSHAAASGSDYDAYLESLDPKLRKTIEACLQPPVTLI